MNTDQAELSGRRIAVPESRQLDLFAGMLERHGAEVLRCPLVSIHDTTDEGPVLAWLDRCIAGEFDDLILLTGEGLRRLLGFAERNGRRDEFVTALADLRITTRGPKPERALRDIGLRGDLKAATPTTDGVIATLSAQDLLRRRVAVQLYGEPNPALVEFLRQAGAEVFTVAPYVYADDAETSAVAALIEQLLSGKVDALAFTSSPQVRRLFSVAQSLQCESELVQTMNGLCIAAVGPIVAETLTRRGVNAILQPETSYFMKPLVTQLCREFGPA